MNQDGPNSPYERLRQAGISLATSLQDPGLPDYLEEIEEWSKGVAESRDAADAARVLDERATMLEAHSASIRHQEGARIIRRHITDLLDRLDAPPAPDKLREAKPPVISFDHQFDTFDRRVAALLRVQRGGKAVDMMRKASDFLCQNDIIDSTRPEEWREYLSKEFQKLYPDVSVTRFDGTTLNTFLNLIERDRPELAPKSG